GNLPSARWPSHTSSLECPWARVGKVHCRPCWRYPRHVAHSGHGDLLHPTRRRVDRHHADTHASDEQLERPGRRVVPTGRVGGPLLALHLQHNWPVPVRSAGAARVLTPGAYRHWSHTATS